MQSNLGPISIKFCAKNSATLNTTYLANIIKRLNKYVILACKNSLIKAATCKTFIYSYNFIYKSYRLLNIYIYTALDYKREYLCIYVCAHLCVCASVTCMYVCVCIIT